MTVPRSVFLLAGIAVLMSACAADPTTPTDAAESPTSLNEVAAPALVGTWMRETRCEELVSALEHAGLERWVLEFVAGNGFVPGASRAEQIADPAHPCEGAVPREHSHFFTSGGVFGSLDWQGEQVDDGTYDVVDDDTFVVSKEFPDVTFNYDVHGDAITFEPVMPDCAPKCFDAAWSVSVAYPGEEWTRSAG